MATETIIIRKRARPGHGGHHGGSWKVALADFAMAMMALFLVLWLVEVSSDEQKLAISDYFSRPGIFEGTNSKHPVDLAGSAPKSAPLEHFRIEGDQLLKKTLFSPTEVTMQTLILGTLKKDLEGDDGLASFGENLRMTSIKEGVLIDIIEDGSHPMFVRGGQSLTPYFEDLLLALAPKISGFQLPIKITGHTDATPFSSHSGRNNWDLSHERAQIAVKTLVHGGLPEASIDQVVAMADRQLLLPDDPTNPMNRRIELVIVTETVESSKPETPSVMEMRSEAQSEAAANQI
ncbi:flagellar motor protein MotB [Endozoicomonas ascidiicola]|uniref:flagellar motor protein MotB n=1 Tax=Endozoicomonas ascidiicola TaxID=1698521 RepID=UPI0008350D35|nr:flagellar motor protein MotB [Endozoicomonas ascidiicola]